MRSDVLRYSKSLLAYFQSIIILENWNIIEAEIVSLVEKYIKIKLTSTRYNRPWFNQYVKKLNRTV